MIKQLSTKTVYKNKWMTVREDEVEFSNGNTGVFGVVEKPDFSLIIPFENNGFFLVKQYRYPVEGSFWEFPQGSHEDKASIDPQELARDELTEETGLRAGKISTLGYLYEAYGYSNQGFHIFLAERLEEATQNLEESESGLKVGFFTVNEFERMMLHGEVRDAPTISAYGLLQARSII